MNRNVDEDVRHKRAVQGALSIGTATLGLAALGSKGGSMALKKYPKALKQVKGLPAKIKNTNADTLNSTSLTLTTAGAGLGGASGYHFAALQRAENKAQKEHMVKKSAFGVVHKADRNTLLEGAGLAGAATGIGTAIASPDVSNLLTNRSRNRLKRATEASTKVQREANMTRMANERSARIANIAGDKKNIKRMQQAEGKIKTAVKTAGSEQKAAAQSAKRAARIFSTGKVAAAGLGLTALGVGTASAARNKRVNRQAPAQQRKEWWA